MAPPHARQAGGSPRHGQVQGWHHPEDNRPDVQCAAYRIRIAPAADGARCQWRSVRSRRGGVVGMERVRVSSSGHAATGAAWRGVASFPHTLERQAQTPRLKTLHPPVPVRTHLPPARSRRPPTTSTTTHARATYRVASRPRTRGARPRQSSRPRRTRSRHTSTSSNDDNENAQPPMEVPHARATQRPHERSPSIMPQAQQPSPTEFAPTQQARPNIDDDVLLRQHAGSGLRQQPTERGASGGPGEAGEAGWWGWKG